MTQTTHTYYPGCTLKATAENFDISTIESAKVLGINLVEPERWNCCGTVHALATDDVMHYLAPIRNMIRVEELRKAGKVDDLQMITVCAMCYNTLKRANQVVNEDSEKMEKIHDIMEKEDIKYSGKVEVKHLLEFFKDDNLEDLKSKIVKPLKGLKVASYYGCLLLRPRGIGIDDTDNPTILEDLMEALGAINIDFAHKQKCCGSYNTVHMKEVVADLSYKILDDAYSSGANILITACPLCEYNLGTRQNEIKKKYPEFNSIPIVYFTQLMALALGLDEATGFNENYPDPRPLLREKGLIKEDQ